MSERARGRREEAGRGRSRVEGQGAVERGQGAVERLRRRDEMLQILFWLQGEGFERDMTVAGIGRFLAWPEDWIRAGLDDLVGAGFAAPAGEDGERWELTDAGRREGGRRFVQEFAPILSRDTHHGSECQDPDCECHDSPLGAAACTGGSGG